MFEQYFEYRDGKLYWKDKTVPTASINIGDKAGSFSSSGYHYVKFFGESYGKHRIIWEMFNGSIPKGMVIDHINNNPSDNRIENLQCITATQNTQRADKLSGFIYRKANGLWQSRKRYNKKEYHLGYFGTACGAYMASRMFFMGGV